MKKKISILFLPFIGLSLILLFLPFCKKDDVNPTNGKTTAVFNPNVSYGSLIDQDGNIYKTVTIGAQTWMAENLRTTKYRNGDDIPEITDSALWDNTRAGAYCTYQNATLPETIATYGRLYNWYAATDGRKVAPPGWHVPTYEEWIILATYLGDSVCGIKLKESGDFHWINPFYQGTNETGFTALPGGYRWRHHYIQMGKEGSWWATPEDTTDIAKAHHITMGTNSPIFGGCNLTKGDGHSIRCVKD